MGNSAAKLRGWFHYETTQIVRIRNVRVSLIYHFAQLVILAYIIGYGLIYKKAYQATGQVVGSAHTKVKGVAYVNQTLPWNGPSDNPCLGDSCFHVYDTFDLIMPPMEENALFVTTNMWVTKNQTRGICSSYASDNTCSESSPCETLKYVNNGRQTGFPGSCRKNYTDPAQKWPQIVPLGSYCDVYAWCPTELEMFNRTLTNDFAFRGVKDFSVFVRMNVNYPKFGFTLDNTNNANTTTNLVNQWTLDQMVSLTGWSWSDIEMEGTTIGLNAVWDCNFDLALDQCKPTLSFVRLDDPNSALSSGFNFRSAEYLHDKYGARQLTKHYGVRLLVLISGVGAKFDWAALFTAIGSGIGLLSVATLIADFIATNLLQNKAIYRAAKYNEIEVVEDDVPGPVDEVGAYQPPRSARHSVVVRPSRDDYRIFDEEDDHFESWGVASFPNRQQ